MAAMGPTGCRGDNRGDFLATFAAPWEIRAMRFAVAAVVAVVAGAPLATRSAHADSDGMLDALGPREIALGDATRGGATGASARSNPAGLPLTSELVFEGGYGYRGIDSTSVVSVSACDSTNAAPGCFYYE